MKKIGILGFQGSVVEHQQHIRKLGQEPVVVRYPEQLPEIDAIILPGGESTTIGKILDRTGLMEPLRSRIEKGMPVWGTCAGMILLAKRLVDESVTYLATMDITVKRNAYGSQIDSFSINQAIPEVHRKELPLVFIRAPYITEIGETVQILSEWEGNIIAARENNMLVTSFHPELTGNTKFHSYFLSFIS
jgi:pyridoxal 5''-phosphate synthase, glutaminase subunit Pdx2